ncbi:MAG: hypothetical protein ACREHE_17600 [Rhizomicrobium sp.]
MRSAWMAAALGWVLATGVAGAATPAGGVYAIIDAAQLAQQKQVVTAALAEPGVDGLLIHLRWGQTSNGFMSYDWTALDDTIALATAAHKRFEIGVVMGGATPGWVTAPAPKGLGAASASFTVNASVGGGCTTFIMAAPYDPNYLKAYRDFLTKLAAHLRTMKTYQFLAMLKLSGLSTTTDEMRLPAIDPPASAHCAASDTLATWQSLGYTPGKVRGAWDAMLRAAAADFPQKSFNIGFIGFNAFPGIRSDGSIATAKSEQAALSARLTANLIGDAGARMPGHIALGFDSLTLSPTNTSAYDATLKAYFSDGAAAGARPGWQTNELLGQLPASASACASGNAATCGGAACAGSTKEDAAPCGGADQFLAMLLAGIYPDGEGNTAIDRQGVYLELFPQNIAQFHSAIPTAHRDLATF